MDGQENPAPQGICNRIFKFLFCCWKTESEPDVEMYNYYTGERLANHRNFSPIPYSPATQMAIGPNFPLRFYREENTINEGLDSLQRASTHVDWEWDDYEFGKLNIVWERCPPQKPRPFLVDTDSEDTSVSDSLSIDESASK